MGYFVGLRHVLRRTRAFLLFAFRPFLLLLEEIQMAADLRCCRCELVLDSAALLQCHEASCYDTPPPRKRSRRWNVSLRGCRRTSYHEEFLSVISPPCKRTRRWCIPLTCSASSFLSLWFLVLLLTVESNLLEGGNLSLANARKRKPMKGTNTR